MNQSALPPIILSGSVHHSRPLLAAVGDACIHPGANRTHYIDGYVYDGREWRRLQLRSFGQVARLFEESTEVGPLMRGIEAVLIGHRGSPVHYERVGRGSAYVYCGNPFPAFLR